MSVCSNLDKTLKQIRDVVDIYYTIATDNEVDYRIKKMYADLLDCLNDNLDGIKYGFSPPYSYQKITSNVALSKKQFEEALIDSNTFEYVIFSENISGFKNENKTIIFRNCVFKDFYAAFFFQNNIEHLVFENCVILNNDASFAFADCHFLQSLTFRADTARVTKTSYMFAGCTHLENLKLSMSTFYVEDMTGMFECCYHLVVLDIGFFSIINLKHYDMMFRSCKNLTHLRLPGDMYKSRDMFWKCKKLRLT